MEASGGKAEKTSRREMKSKSVTLPPGAVLLAQPGEGFFSKVRKCLRLRSKGKYDFNHPRPTSEPFIESPSSPRSKHGDEVQANDAGDQKKQGTKFSPLKLSRRNKSDKEEVVVIRKDRKSTSRSPFALKRSSAEQKDEVLVVTVEESESNSDHESVAGASALNCENNHKMGDIAFDEFDPDYETLDNIRHKMRAQADDDQTTAPPELNDNAGSVEGKAAVHVKVRGSSEVSGRDSGVDSPHTDSPGSSQPHSVNGSVFSNSPNFSENFEANKETSHNIPSVILGNGTALPLPDKDPMVISSTSSSMSCSNIVLEEDDLYSNAKVLIRKKSQKQPLSSASFSSIDQRSSGLFVDQSGSARNSLTPADLLAMMEAENPDPPAPPPLPARNYSEEDMTFHDQNLPGGKRSSQCSSTDACASEELHLSVSSETLCERSGARARASRLSVTLEDGPILTKRFNCDSYQESKEDLSPTEILLISGQAQRTPVTPTNNIYEDIPVNNIYEDIPARTKCEAIVTDEQTDNAESSNLAEIKKDSLSFIDEDTSASFKENASVPVHTGDLPEDVMIVSASDSMCGSETENPHSSTDALVPNPIDKHLFGYCSEGASGGEKVEKSDSESNETDSHSEDKELQYPLSLHDSEGSVSCSRSESVGVSSENLLEQLSPNRTASSSSSSHQISVSSPSGLSSTSSTDTLNDIGDAEADPDDFEGKELSPPVGPPIHISHQQLLRCLGARTLPPLPDEPPPVPPHRNVRPLSDSQQESASTIPLPFNKPLPRSPEESEAPSKSLPDEPVSPSKSLPDEPVSPSKSHPDEPQLLSLPLSNESVAPAFLLPNEPVSPSLLLPCEPVMRRRKRHSYRSPPSPHTLDPPAVPRHETEPPAVPFHHDQIPPILPPHHDEIPPILPPHHDEIPPILPPHHDEIPPVLPPHHDEIPPILPPHHDEIPPAVPPHRPVLRRPRASRDARSMDMTACCLADRESVGARPKSSRRHSSSSAASRAHRDFVESMRQLKDCGWYWGPLSYEEAENKLIDKRDGSFLVRDSSNENYILSLSFKSMGQVHHTRIEHHKGLFSFWSQPDSHGKARICQFIEQTVENSKNGRFLYFLRPAGPGSPPLPIQLLFPVSRFCRVPSLQHMCRFLLLRSVRRDHIEDLPLPQKVKSYLLEKQYYVETLEED